MNAVDTNILIYAQDFREQGKQRVAQSLIASLEDGVLLWQVASEYLAAARKLQPLGFSYAAALANIQDLRESWATVLPSWSVQDRAVDLINRHSLSFWDAMIVAACAETGVRRLYSEDITGYPALDGVELINPF